MPFPASWIEKRLAAAGTEKRLAHAYLLTGTNLEDLKPLFQRIAATLLQSGSPNHPDLHVIRPESKSRRLTVEQIRQLEQQLQLKAREGGLKIAGIIAADRMCLGSAEAANAFLKTLEEPPAHTVIFLLSDRPEQLLPTIRSRCLLLPMQTGSDSTAARAEAWAEEWWTLKGKPADLAYKRASLLSENWRQLRENMEKRSAEKEDEDDAKAAQMEAEYLLARDNGLRMLILHGWRQAIAGDFDRQKTSVMVQGLEELRYALSQNIEQNMALERSCLLMEGLIEENSLL